MRRWRQAMQVAAAGAMVAVATLVPGTAAFVGTGSPAGAASAGRASARATTAGAVPSPGCATASRAASGSNPPGAVDEQQQTIAVDGTSRFFLLTAPEETVGTGGRARPLPLVLDFHGLAEGAQIQAKMSGFSPLALRDRFVVAFPNGTGSPVQWNVTAGSASNPDLSFVQTMLTTIEADRCIDLSRVYADGFSDGALFSSLLACTLPRTFAAIAAVSGLQMPRPCTLTHRMPVLTFHGTGDPILYFNGGVGTSYLNAVLKGQASYTSVHLPKANLNGGGVPATVRSWAAKDGCGTRVTDTQVAAHVLRRTYPCPAGASIVFYVVEGGGHAWPGSTVSRSLAPFTGPTTFEINATDTIWSFFRHHRLPGPR